jgi:uncharacterized protein DUF4232
MSVATPPPQDEQELLIREARARRRRRWTLVAAAVAVISGAAVAASSLGTETARRSAATSTAAPALAVRCTLSELRVHRIGSYAGLGESGGYYGLTNSSLQRCSLRGWPYVEAIRADGTTATGKHVQETFYGPFRAPRRPPTVNLRPGTTAAFALTTGDSTLSGKGPCPAPYTRLRIGLVRGSTAKTISAWIPYYGRYFQACTRFEVSEIVPKSDLRG